MPERRIGRFPGPRSLVLAYHGCDESIGRKLISGEITKVNFSSNTYDWIGAGAYFFENDYDRALYFAETCAANPDKRLTRGVINSPFVVGAVIDLGFCLDLSRQEGIAEVADAYQAMVDAGVAIPKNEESFAGDEDIVKRKLDRAIINYLHKIRTDLHGKTIEGTTFELPPYDTVRSPFPQGPAIATTSAFKMYSHVQIAVRNSNRVLGYFLPRTPVAPEKAFNPRG